MAEKFYEFYNDTTGQIWCFTYDFENLTLVLESDNKVVFEKSYASQEELENDYKKEFEKILDEPEKGGSICNMNNRTLMKVPPLKKSKKSKKG